MAFEHKRDPERTAETVPSWHAGANSRLAPWLLEKDTAVEIENMFCNNVGTLSQRPGMTAFGGVHPGVSAPPGGISSFNDASYNDFLAGIWGTYFYRSSGNGGWAQVGSGASMVPGLLHQFVAGRIAGQLAILACTCEQVTETSKGIGGRSRLMLYNIEANAATQASLAPSCIAPFQSRIFYGENETLGWSEIGGLMGYSPSANSILIEPGIGRRITAIVPTRDLDPKMYVFKEEAICIFSPRWGASGSLIPGSGDALDTVNSSVRVLSDGIGCIATRSVQWVPGAESADIFFLARDGVRSMRRAENDVQAGAGFPISYTIPGWIERINFTKAHKAVAAVFDNAYHLAVPMDGANDNTHVLRYDIGTQAWTLHSIRSKDLLTFRLGDNERLWMQSNLATGDCSVSGFVAANPPYQVFRVYSGTYDPSTSASLPVYNTWGYTSRMFSGTDPTRKKRFGRFMFQMSSADTCAFSIAYRRDQGNWSTVTNVRLGGTGDSIVLGIEPLPWNSPDEEIRKRSITIEEIAPAYFLQNKLTGITGATEIGRVSLYNHTAESFPYNPEHANDP